MLADRTQHGTNLHERAALRWPRPDLGHLDAGLEMQSTYVELLGPERVIVLFAKLDADTKRVVDEQVVEVLVQHGTSLDRRRKAFDDRAPVERGRSRDAADAGNGRYQCSRIGLKVFVLLAGNIDVTEAAVDDGLIVGRVEAVDTR